MICADVCLLISSRWVPTRIMGLFGARLRIDSIQKSSLELSKPLVMFHVTICRSLRVSCWNYRRDSKKHHSPKYNEPSWMKGWWHATNGNESPKSNAWKVTSLKSALPFTRSGTCKRDSWVCLLKALFCVWRLFYLNIEKADLVVR